MIERFVKGLMNASIYIYGIPLAVAVILIAIIGTFRSGLVDMVFDLVPEAASEIGAREKRVAGVIPEIKAPMEGEILGYRFERVEAEEGTAETDEAEEKTSKEETSPAEPAPTPTPTPEPSCYPINTDESVQSVQAWLKGDIATAFELWNAAPDTDCLKISFGEDYLKPFSETLKDYKSAVESEDWDSAVGLAKDQQTQNPRYMVGYLAERYALLRQYLDPAAQGQHDNFKPHFSVSRREEAGNLLAGCKITVGNVDFWKFPGSWPGDRHVHNPADRFAVSILLAQGTEYKIWVLEYALRRDVLERLGIALGLGKGALVEENSEYQITGNVFPTDTAAPKVPALDGYRPEESAPPATNPPASGGESDVEETSPPSTPTPTVGERRGNCIFSKVCGMKWVVPETCRPCTP